MSSQRLRERIPDARSLGCARLEGWRLCCNKPGSDGSGKANLVADAAAVTWGVLFTFDVVHWPTLDRFEPGYERVVCRVIDSAERSRPAQVYLSSADGAQRPVVGGYRDHLLAGAREHGLPDDYIAMLGRVPIRSD